MEEEKKKKYPITLKQFDLIVNLEDLVNKGTLTIQNKEKKEEKHCMADLTPELIINYLTSLPPNEIKKSTFDIGPPCIKICMIGLFIH